MVKPMNVKGYLVPFKVVHTINIQAVCDADMKLLNVVARWPGSTHNSFIWRTSNLHHLFDHEYIQGSWLLGITFNVYCLSHCIFASVQVFSTSTGMT